MENLVPREIYDVDDSGYGGRLAWATGIFFGLGMGTACLFLTPSIIGFSWRVLLSICAGLVSGIAFGWSVPRRFRKKMSSIIARIYAGDTDIAVPPPETELRYRLPCSWKRSEKFSVGGVLYIGPLGLLFFVPHRMNLPRDRSMFEMGPNKSLKLSLTTRPLNGFLKLLVPRQTGSAGSVPSCLWAKRLPVLWGYSSTVLNDKLKAD